MVGKIKRISRQNNGSTLIIVLAVVAFLSILAVVVTSAAVTNYKMKVVNKQSQKAFYTSEDAVDELYAALGKLSLECFNDAYNEEISNVVKQTQVGGSNVSYTVSSRTANESLRKNFTFRLLKKLELVKEEKVNNDIVKDRTFGTDEEKTEFAALLNKFLEGEGKKEGDEENGLYVESVEGIRLEEIKGKTKTEGVTEAETLDRYILRFTGCRIKYRNEESYYSYITFDGELSMPDIYIDFVTETADIPHTFTDYALVGNTGIVIAENNVLNLSGNAYAGKITGLTVKGGSSLNVNGSTTQAYRLVSGGDINVEDGNFKTAATEIWCNSLMTSGNNGSVITVTGGSTYVKDDLQVDGDNSTVTIGGEYYGYSYQGNEVAEGNHNNSSAIIVNGARSRVDLTGLKTLVLGGRAYIDYKTGASSYATGESLSLKGTQEMYLVPSYMMSRANPAVGDITDVEVNITAENFFGYSYLHSDLYTTREVRVDGSSKPVTYYYFKFKDSDASRDYVKAVLDDGAYSELKNEVLGSSPDRKKAESAYDKARAYIRSVIQANPDDMPDTVKTAAGSSVYTSGQMINADFTGGNRDINLGNTSFDYQVGGNTFSTDGFLLDSYDLSNRYSLLTRILMSKPFKKENGDRNYIYELGNYVLIDDKPVDISGYGENNVFANFISMEAFKELTSKEENRDGYINGSVEGYPDSVVCCAIRNSVPIEIGGDNPDNPFQKYSSGIIITSGDVTVKKDFTGTIISGGTITVDGNVTVRGDATLVNDILKKDSDLSGILNANRPQGTGSSDEMLKGINYKNFVTFANWKKSE